jgi:glycosyltransferase involved in cell wall biosynthesis
VHLSVRGSFVREGTIAVAAAALGAPVVVSLHGGEMTSFIAHHSRLARAVLGQADAIIALGPASRNTVQPFLPASTRLVEIANPVDVPVNPGPAGSTPAQVLFAGEQRELKGLDVLLEAWPQVRAAQPDAKLVVVGRPGNVRRDSMAGVEWHGAVPRTQVARLLLGSRVATLPSRAEVMPMFLLEAMAAARPVVTTPVGEIESLVGRDGTLVPVGDPARLAEALAGFLADGNRATTAGARLRRRVEERFAPQRIADQLEALYDELR